MLKINILGGGYYEISEWQIKCWQYMYRNIEVRATIEEMIDQDLFQHKTAMASMKMINNVLSNLNENMESITI